MYDALKRRIKKEGINTVILDLSSENISENFKENVKPIYVDGFLNLSLLYSLV